MLIFLPFSARSTPQDTSTRCLFEISPGQKFVLDALIPLLFAAELGVLMLGHRAAAALFVRFRPTNGAFNWRPYKRSFVSMFLYSYQVSQPIFA